MCLYSLSEGGEQRNHLNTERDPNLDTNTLLYLHSIWVQPKHLHSLLAAIMDIYLYIYIFVILIFEILADEFCQQNLDGVEECEGNINKDPEVQFF